MVTIHTGDCREVLKTLADCSVNCCVTSPPYWGLRDYGHAGQIGQEKSPEEFVAALVGVFREVRRVLADDGTLWLNLGDSYANYTKWGGSTGGKHAAGCHGEPLGRGKRDTGLKGKDLVGIPWRVAFALQADGWWLRQDIIWSKPNPMPESVTDRCTKSHEYIFLLSKAARYYYDAEAIAEAAETNDLRRPYGSKGAWDLDGRPEEQKHGGELRAVGRGGKNAFRGQGHFRDGENGPANREGRDMKNVGVGRASGNVSHKYVAEYDGSDTEEHGTKAGMLKISGTAYPTRNKRSVWTVTTKPYREAHFATFPPDLITPCILAGSRVGGTVLDPFGGSGTTGEVAEAHGRHSVLIELNPAYVKLSEKRTAQGGLLHVA